MLVACTLLGGSPVSSEETVGARAPDAVSAGSTDTLQLGAIDPAVMEMLRINALPRDGMDPWRNGSSAAEIWQTASAQNLAVQQTETVRLGIETRAATGRVRVGEHVLAAVVNRNEVIRQRLTALVVDSFVNNEADALDKLSGANDRLRIDAPTDVATETLMARRARAAEEVQRTRSTVQARNLDAETVRIEARMQSDALDEAKSLDRAARLFGFDHSTELRRRELQTLEASGDAPDTVMVGQFRVSPQIAGPLSDLLAAAAAAEEPIIFGGWGYRSTEEQINLRDEHCGSTGFAIFDGPSPACAPPTARPLHSEHERGLAIDFTQDGAILSTASSGYTWLQENAATYGFFNLPSEPWHWSTTGH